MTRSGLWETQINSAKTTHLILSVALTYYGSIKLPTQRERTASAESPKTKINGGDVRPELIGRIILNTIDKTDSKIEFIMSLIVVEAIRGRWRRMLRISWMEKRTDNSILQELEIKRELLGHVRKRKLTYYGHLCRDHGCQLTKTVVEGYVEGRRRRGRPRKQYIDNIKQWTQLTTSQCVRAAEDRSRWKQLVSQAMVADDYT